jgi:hypothetical protein
MNYLRVVLCVVAVSFSASVCVAEGTTVVEKLTNPDGRERLAAYHGLLSSNAQVVSNLIDIVRQPVRQGEVWGNPSSSRNLAIRLLGHFRVAEAVDSIIPFLTPRPGQDAAVLMGRDGQDNVAEAALVRIGTPSVEPLLSSVFASADSSSAKACLTVLRRLLPGEELKKRFETATAASADQKRMALSLLGEVP